MGSIRVRARIIGLALLGTHFAGAAAAAERISMPFDCRYDGARVELSPAPERSYLILGRHESEIFSACSPADPNRCRSWFVHRFELDCNGARVAWLDVAEAAMRYYDRPGWVEDGSFHVRMGPLWTFEGRSAFREGQRRWLRERDATARDGYGRYDDEERSYRDGRVVTLPRGYAPAQGIPVAFSGAPDEPAPARTAAMPPPPFETRTSPPVAAAMPAAQPAPPKPEPVPELPERAPRREIAAAKAPPAPQPVAAVPDKPEATSQKLAMAEPAKSALAAATSDDEASEPAAKPPALTIINGPQAKQAAPESEAVSSTDVESDVAEAPATKSGGEMTGDISTGSTQAAPKEEAVAEAEPDSAQVAPPASFVPPAAEHKTIITPMTIAAALALALAALAAVLGFRRRTPELVHVTPPASRDYGSISLGGFRSTPPATAPGSSLSLRAEAPEPVSDAPLSSPAAADSLVMTPDFPVPSSYEQALDVLGVSPNASLAAIKKIVDGMRLSWHPDHARSEADRLYRESRSRQINVAWDLVSERRSAA